MEKKVYLGGEDINPTTVLPDDFKEFFEKLIKFLLEGEE